jgi:protein SCO1
MQPHNSSLRSIAAAACVAAAVGFAAFAYRATSVWEPSQPAASVHEPSDLVSLVDQAKRPFSLRALEGRTVVLSFIFTHCQTSCPLQTQALVGVQRALSKRVQLVSVSIDPLRDTPQELTEYAEAMGAQLDNWSFVTGHPQEIAWLHKHFGAQVKRGSGDQLDHRVAVYLLDAHGQLAQKYVGDIDPQRLAREIGEVDSLYQERAQVR